MSFLLALAMQVATTTEVPPVELLPPPPPPIVFIVIPPPPVILALNPPPPIPPKLPEQVKAVIDAAIDSGDPAAVAAVVKFAKATNPETAAQVDAMNTAYLANLEAKRLREERQRRDALLAAGPLDYWTGQVEAGASRSTGNTRNLGLYGSVKLGRNGINWQHKVEARADIQKTDGVTTTERILGSWQPNYKIDDRLYAYGLGQYEHDPFLGYDHRYTAGSGMGFHVIAKPDIRLDLEGGPAVRYTDYVVEPAQTTIAGRASLAFNWKITPTLTLTQDGAMFVETGNTNASSTTALETQLIGALKARFSYHIQYERDAPIDNRKVDTLSRATLLYNF